MLATSQYAFLGTVAYQLHRGKHYVKENNKQMRLYALEIRNAIARNCFVVLQRGLNPPHKHGPIYFHHNNRNKQTRNKKKQNKKGKLVSYPTT